MTDLEKFTKTLDELGLSFYQSNCADIYSTKRLTKITLDGANASICGEGHFVFDDKGNFYKASFRDEE